MSVELEWHFENQAPDEAPQQEKRPRRLRWRFWLSLAGAVVLLVAAGLYVRWRVQREVLKAVEAEVQAVAQLELQALAKGDTDLYLGLQDEADPNWREVQKAHATIDVALPLPLPGLTTTTALSVENARVVGNLARVEMVRQAGLPDEQTAPFRALRFYRRSDDGRWLHTRADLGYAGHAVIFTGQQVAVTTYAIDAELVRPVASSLEKLASRFCMLVSCQMHVPLALVLTDTLDTAVEPEGTLPAPFIVGVPDSEEARAAWEAALHELLLGRLIAREFGQPAGSAGRGSEGVELFRARLHEWLRATLELRPPIAVEPDLIGQALDAGEWISLETLWNAPPAAGDPQRPLAEIEIDLLLAFVEQEYGPSSVARILRLLDEVPWIATWIQDTTGENWPTFYYQYAAYVRQAAGRPIEVEPPGEVLPFAEYDLVAACTGPTNLWGVRLDGPEATPLSPAAGIGALFWSPDGTRLLAWRDMLYGDGLYLLAANGAGVRQLTSAPAGARPVGWSPDGRYVAYSTLGQPPEGGLVDVEADARVALGSTYRVAWSPDGSQLAYVTQTGEWLSVLDAVQGSGITMQLAYVTQTGEWLSLWLADGDGSNPRQVGHGLWAAWSPDGRHIAISRTSPDSSLEIYNLATEATTTLLDPSAVYDVLGFETWQGYEDVRATIWSPTGDWIGFDAGQYNDAGPVKGVVGLIRPDGSDLRILSTRAGSVYVTDWSPDGKWLSFVTVARSGEPYTTTVIRPDGSDLRILSTRAGSVYVATDWSPDGEWLSFVTVARSGEPYTTTVIGTDGTLLLETDATVTWSPDGRYLAVNQPHEEGGVRILEVQTRTWYTLELPARCTSIVWNPRGPLHAPLPSPDYTEHP